MAFAEPFWPSYLRQLQFVHDDQRPEVQYFVRQDLQRLGIIQIELLHSRYTIPYIVDALRARHMPVDLALLPFIESGYEPFTESGAGAIGLWQLMPITAETFGYRINNPWVDPAYNIVLSTKIALDNLQSLHHQFGNWFLALAAYNAGPGTVLDVIRRAADHHQRIDYWSLPLPDQTRDYVPRLLAMSYLLRHAAYFHLVLPPMPRDMTPISITVPYQLSLRRIVRDADIPEGLFASLNPGFSSGTTPPGRTQILLPSVNVWAFDAHFYGDR